MKHSVSFDLPTRDLGKADIHVYVKIDGKVLGKLEVSKGSVVWYPKDMTYGHKATWLKLDQMMKTLPSSERRKHP